MPQARQRQHALRHDHITPPRKGNCWSQFGLGNMARLRRAEAGEHVISRTGRSRSEKRIAGEGGKNQNLGTRERDVSAILEQLSGNAGATPAMTTLFRPVGLHEFALIWDSGMREFPPRLPHQPIFYPVVHVEYATQIAQHWNTRDASPGFAEFVGQFAGSHFLPRSVRTAYPLAMDSQKGVSAPAPASH
jgi:hypothetical protein